MQQSIIRAAAAGDSAGARNLGIFYETGRGIARDYDKARSFYEKAAAAGNPAAMNNLGLLYENARGVPQDYAEARRWYERAAAAGDSAGAPAADIG
jgi:uncharacterized protein